MDHRRPVIRSITEAESIYAGLLNGAARTADWLRGFSGDPIALLKALRFELVGHDPLTGEPLNVVEQLNQMIGAGAAKDRQSGAGIREGDHTASGGFHDQAGRGVQAQSGDGEAVVAGYWAPLPISRGANGVGAAGFANAGRAVKTAKWDLDL
jgi:hypothetical protein